MKKQKISLGFIMLAVITLLFLLKPVSTFAFTEQESCPMNFNGQLSEKKLIGNWVDPDKNEWLYGFFKDFAIYKSKKWEYKEILQKKNELFIKLIDEKEELELKIKQSKKDENIIKIAVGKEKYITLNKITSPTLPAYKISDNSKFTDNGYKPDSVKISGYYKNINEQQKVEIEYKSLFARDEITFQTTIDTNGWFEIKFPLINTTEVSIELGELIFTTALEANEEIFIFYDSSGEQILAMGENARFHNEIIQYKNIKYQHDKTYYLTDMSHDLYLDKHKEIYTKNLEILNEYVTQYPGEVSDKFLEFQTKKILANIANHLIQRCFALKRNEKFSEYFMNFIEEEIMANLPKPYTLISEFNYFLKTYLDYMEEALNYASPFPWRMCINYLINNNIIDPTKEQLEMLEEFETFHNIETILKEIGTPQTIIDERTKPYKKAYEEINKMIHDPSLSSYLEKEWEKISEELVDLKTMGNPIAIIEYLFQDNHLRDMMITYKFYHQLDWKRSAYNKATVQYFSNKISNIHLVKYLLSLQEYYENLETEVNEYVDNLSLTDQYGEIEDSEKLFNLLIEPYKGKVIYIDFWGTWCGPCKENMAYMPPIKERFKDKDIIFMYIAYFSPETSWKNVIKQYDLTGENVVHYNLPKDQQEKLNDTLFIREFPTYFLIDKQGNIANKNAASPLLEEQLIRQIEELID